MIIETVKLHEMGLFPELFLGIGIIYLIMHGVFVSYTNTNKFPLIQSSMIFLGIIILIQVCFLFCNDSLINVNFVSFCNTVTNDFLSTSAKIVICISAIGCLLLIRQYLITQQINSFEYIIILLFAVLGLFMLCSSNDLITAYLAIELQSLSFYVLAAFKKNSTYSVESGLKYFILGAFSSGLFLFGSSLIYGVSGTVNFEELKDLFIFDGSPNYVLNMFMDKLNVFNYLSNEVLGNFSILNTETIKLDKFLFHYNFSYNSLVLIGLMFIFISLFFKLALAPFHLWSPDVYEGSPSSSTFFFVVVPKLSIFVLLVRLSNYAFPAFVNVWENYIIIIAIGSVIVGSVAGLEQRKFKSLLAYSSISHMGYLLIAFCAGTTEGFQMLFCYIIIYMGSGLCVWSIFMLLRLKIVNSNKQNKDLGDFVLLRKSNNSLALILAIALLSVAGLPPMVGFLVKLSIFLVAIEQSLYTAALLSIVFSVISTFYYLRIIKIIYFEPLLVGRLYYPIDNQYGIVVALLFYLFLFLFINPTMLYLFSSKVSILFL